LLKNIRKEDKQKKINKIVGFGTVNQSNEPAVTLLSTPKVPLFLWQESVKVKTNLKKHFLVSRWALTGQFLWPMQECRL
jgi:hypothetical protein